MEKFTAQQIIRQQILNQQRASGQVKNILITVLPIVMATI